MSSFLAVRVSTERSQQTCRAIASLSKETIGGEIVDRHRDHEPLHIAVFPCSRCKT